LLDGCLDPVSVDLRWRMADSGSNCRIRLDRRTAGFGRELPEKRTVGS